MLIVGTIAALAAGGAMPSFVFFFGKLTDSFNPAEEGDETLSKFYFHSQVSFTNAD
jgi:hypothetical protein